ncbi:DsbA family protein (plasmid) [Coraliomargarita sp. W4R53]
MSDVAAAGIESKYKRAKLINVILAAVVVFLVVVVFAQMTTGASPQSAPASTQAAEDAAQSTSGQPQIVLRDPADPMALGDVDAPIVMVQWTDMRCPYCAVFSRDTLPVLVEEYVDNGDVRIEVRDVAFFGDGAPAAAARAAGNQGMFAEYISAVYEAAPESGHPDLPREQLISVAKEIGVPDMDRFAADIDDPELLALVSDSTSTAQQLGVNSVPFFVVGDQALAGAQPVDVFREFLDAALAQVQ